MRANSSFFIPVQAIFRSYLPCILGLWLGCDRDSGGAPAAPPRDPAPGDTIPWVDGPDNANAVPPILGETRSIGNVTTYGSVSDPLPSVGGACNYGKTEVANFAAIDVNVLPGDGKGQWQGGGICGQCAKVEVRTREGVKSTVVRIMDKCPDANCGVDLGGQPAKTLMGGQPGRYSGSWEWVSCEGQEGVSDGPPVLFVKEGSNAYWSVVQVRNPPGAVLSIVWSSAMGTGVFAYATEAENFFKVPQAVLDAKAPVTLTISFSFGDPLEVVLTGGELAAAGKSYPLQKQ